MIQDSLDKEQLAHQISLWADDVIKGRQVYSRLHRLLPERYVEIVKSLRAKHDAGKARRLALLDPRFLAHLDEVNDLSHSIHKSKVQWDTHLMYFKIKKF